MFNLEKNYESVAVMPGNLPFEDITKYCGDKITLILADFLSIEQWKQIKDVETYDKDLFVRKIIKTSKVYELEERFTDYHKLLYYVYEDSSLYHIMSRKMSQKSIYDADVWIEKVVFESLRLLEKHKIDVIITHDTPHVIFDYIFCKVAQYLNIDIYNIRRSALPWRSYLEKGIKFGIPIPRVNSDVSAKDRSDVDQFLKEKSDNYENAIPIYERRRLNKYKGKVWNWKIEIVNHFFKSGKKPHVSAVGLITKYKAYSNYITRVKGWDINDKIVCFFLHFQPERTTLPEGSIFDQQILAIRMLRLILPDDIKIVVKEHPSTFRAIYNSHVRSKNYYSTIASMPNVILADMSVSPFDLIDQSLFIGTITGSVAMESVCRDKCCVYFGNAQYKNLPGTYFIDEICENEGLLQELISGKLDPHLNKVNQHLQSLLHHTFGKVPEGEELYEKDISYIGGSQCLQSFLLSVENKKIETNN